METNEESPSRGSLYDLFTIENGSKLSFDLTAALTGTAQI